MNNELDADLRAVLISQFTAALEMMRQTVAQCPDSLWLSASLRNQFWRVAYHALFYVHFYVYPTEHDFVPWSKHRDEVESAHDERPDAAPYSQQDVLEYLDFCVAQVQFWIPQLDFRTASGFPWYAVNKLEMEFINLRHLQQHVGELSEQLSDKTGRDIRWRGFTPAKSSAA